MNIQLLSNYSISWLSIYCRELLEFVSHNDDKAREIADRGHDMILSHLRMKDVSCYWKKLLKRYAKLLQFKPERDKSLVERDSSWMISEHSSCVCEKNVQQILRKKCTISMSLLWSIFQCAAECYVYSKHLHDL